MATTGFWPVKNRLKEVIDYARNPDKTTERSAMSRMIKKPIRQCMCRVSTVQNREPMNI